MGSSARGKEGRGNAAAALDVAGVRRVLAGERAAFEGIVRRHVRTVYRAVRSVLRDGSDVEDAVQQTFLQAFVGLDRFKGASSLSTWLVRIALNEALGRRKRRAVLSGMAPATEAMASTAPGPERVAAAREEIDLVRRAAVRLSPNHREVFRLRHVEGLSTAEAAARLGITEAAVKVRLHRARRVLRVAAAADGADGDGGGTAPGVFDEP